MHSLLMERGRIINSLIEIKAQQGGGSAFRPAREAAMMRALAERHRGLLPLDTAEGIWRIIISTFTYVQAPYSVHADASHGDPAMRDSVRFHFGFTVPCISHSRADAVITAVRNSGNDLGVVALDSGPRAGPWWLRLVGPETPKVIARLPFVERPDHPAGMPILVISKPLAEGVAREVVLEAVNVDRWRDDYIKAIAGLGGDVIGSAAAGVGLSLLVARRGNLPEGAVAGALTEAGAADVRTHEIGSHAEHFEASKR
jgi:chorismate mutase